MAARGYVLGGGGLTLAAQAVTLTFVNPAASPALAQIFRRFWVGQSGTTTAAQQRVQFSTQVTAFPTLVSATPAKLRLSGPASIITGNTTGAAGTCGINASAEGGGAKTVLWSDTFGIVNGGLWVLTPDELIIMDAGAASGLGFHLPVSVGANTANWNFGCTWTEE